MTLRHKHPFPRLWLPLCLYPPAWEGEKMKSAQKRGENSMVPKITSTNGTFPWPPLGYAIFYPFLPLKKPHQQTEVNIKGTSAYTHTHTQ